MRLSRIATVATTLCVLAALPALGQEKPWLHVQIQGDDDDTKVEVNLPLAAIEALGGSLGERMLDEMAEEWEHEAGNDIAPKTSGRFGTRFGRTRGPGSSIDEEDGSNLRARMDGKEIRIEGSGDDGSLDIRFPVAFGDALFGEAGSDPTSERRSAVSRTTRMSSSRWTETTAGSASGSNPGNRPCSDCLESCWRRR